MKDQSEYNAYRIPVPPEFEEVFSHFYVAENTSRNAVRRRLLPSYQTILIFNFGTKALLQSGDEEIETGKCLALGPVKRAFEYTLPPGSEILVVNFRDDAFYRFFGNAMIAENLRSDPDALTGEGCFSDLWEQLNTLPDTDLRVNFILDFCRPYLKKRNPVIGRLASFDDKSLDVIKTLAEETGQTERNMQLWHRKYLGYSAKEIRRYYRFLKAVEMVQQGITSASGVNWFDIIHQCNYYDQSQLIRDFKHYLDLTPTRYLKFQQEICNPVG
ncbi:helix-turn-helix domain-containing protein [Sinomicrobium weinanense]|uniref:AraC family transcriptional regulator n=1 Tax=Sinomicrobium weinanense TaxID=2842200 RepID=A0A926JTR1_9FLAO|nr:helix-turn-helix domain-containing protein [Sinomicrobium weinanense]MBC9797088.1 AraC family transcriptional regulator [Sinomicrobium weinanense]MBU3122683.1 helix-turn-helix domain-containing protein [Sinomicrobium weinanense]